MVSEIALRAALAGAILLAGAALSAGLGRLARSDSRGKLAALGGLLDGRQRTLLVYFTTPQCAPCRTVQEPAIRQVQSQLRDELEVVKIDATARPELADRWGVLSVPTTFLVRAGEVRRVNRGVVRAEQLMQQIEGL